MRTMGRYGRRTGTAVAAKEVKPLDSTDGGLYGKLARSLADDAGLRVVQAGTGCFYRPDTKTIHIPANVNDLLTKAAGTDGDLDAGTMKDVLDGMFVHERRHAEEEDKAGGSLIEAKKASSGMRGFLLNAVEDVRIEANVRYEGERRMLDALHRFGVRLSVEQAKAKPEFADSFRGFTTELYTRAFGMSGTRLSDRLEGALSEALPLVRSLVGREFDATVAATDAIEKILSRWMAPEPKAESKPESKPAQQPEAGDEGDDAEGDDDGEGGEGDGDEGDREDNEAGEDGQPDAPEGEAEGEDSGEGDDDGEANDGDDDAGEAGEGDDDADDADDDGEGEAGGGEGEAEEGDDDAGEGDDAGDDDGEGEAAEGEGDDAGEGDEGEAGETGEAGEGDDDGEAEDGEAEAGEGDADPGAEGGEAVEDPEAVRPLEDLFPGEPTTDVMDEVRKAIGDEAGESLDETRGYVASPAAKLSDRITVPRNGDAAEYDSMKRRVEKVIGGLRSRLVTALKAKADVLVDPDQEEGRLDRSALYRVEMGDRRVFYRQVETAEDVPAVAILIDESGSMNEGGKYQVARLAAIALGETLAKLNVPFAMYGFTNDHGGEFYATSRNGMGGSNGRSLPMNLIEYKAFQDRWTTVRTRATQIKGREQNADGDAVDAVARILRSQPADRRILMVLSDGAPACPGNRIDADGAYKDYSAREVEGEHLKAVVRAVEKSGTEVVGIGILSSAVREFYRNVAVVNDLNDLPKVVYKSLSQSLIGGRGARRVAR